MSQPTLIIEKYDDLMRDRSEKNKLLNNERNMVSKKAYVEYN